MCAYTFVSACIILTQICHQFYTKSFSCTSVFICALTFNRHLVSKNQKRKKKEIQEKQKIKLSNTRAFWCDNVNDNDNDDVNSSCECDIKNLIFCFASTHTCIVAARHAVCFGCINNDDSDNKVNFCVISLSLSLCRFYYFAALSVSIAFDLKCFNVYLNVNHIKLFIFY